ncbi:mucin-binding protein [Lacticaseibacillus absianus]|uniref:mucin-binding protein n=1 Tax=Lacticaseibacillus absianus TaxID=2729623 RepID=UPI0015C8D857|nr:MBG domain-containing protein [Lacticaseibacillus absianus]
MYRCSKGSRLLRDTAEEKRHYKMYKKGKLWMTAGLSLLYAGMMLTNQLQEVHADEADGATAVVADQAATTETTTQGGVVLQSSKQAAATTASAQTTPTAEPAATGATASAAGKTATADAAEATEITDPTTATASVAAIIGTGVTLQDQTVTSDQVEEARVYSVTLTQGLVAPAWTAADFDVANLSSESGTYAVTLSAKGLRALQDANPSYRVTAANVAAGHLIVTAAQSAETKTSATEAEVTTQAAQTTADTATTEDAATIAATETETTPVPVAATNRYSSATAQNLAEGAAKTLAQIKVFVAQDDALAAADETDNIVNNAAMKALEQHMTTEAAAIADLTVEAEALSVTDVEQALAKLTQAAKLLNTMNQELTQAASMLDKDKYGYKLGAKQTAEDALAQAALPDNVSAIVDDYGDLIITASSESSYQAAVQALKDQGLIGAFREIVDPNDQAATHVGTNIFDEQGHYRVIAASQRDFADGKMTVADIDLTGIDPDNIVAAYFVAQAEAGDSATQANLVNGGQLQLYWDDFTINPGRYFAGYTADSDHSKISSAGFGGYQLPVMAAGNANNNAFLAYVNDLDLARQLAGGKHRVAVGLPGVKAGSWNSVSVFVVVRDPNAPLSRVTINDSGAATGSTNSTSVLTIQSNIAKGYQIPDGAELNVMIGQGSFPDTGDSITGTASVDGGPDTPLNIKVVAPAEGWINAISADVNVQAGDTAGSVTATFKLFNKAGSGRDTMGFIVQQIEIEAQGAKFHYLSSETGLPVGVGLQGGEPFTDVNGETTTPMIDEKGTFLLQGAPGDPIPREEVDIPGYFLSGSETGDTDWKFKANGSTIVKYYYTPNTQKINVTYVDDDATDPQDLSAFAETMSGKTDADADDTLWDFASAGYEWVGEEDQSQGAQGLGTNADHTTLTGIYTTTEELDPITRKLVTGTETDQSIVIHLKHKVTATELGFSVSREVQLLEQGTETELQAPLLQADLPDPADRVTDADKSGVTWHVVSLFDEATQTDLGYDTNGDGIADTSDPLSAAYLDAGESDTLAAITVPTISGYTAVAVTGDTQPGDTATTIGALTIGSDYNGANELKLTVYYQKNVAEASVQISGFEKVYDNDSSQDPTTFTLTSADPALQIPALTEDDFDLSAVSQEVGTYDIKLSAAGLQKLQEANPSYYLTTASIGVGHFTVTPAEVSVTLAYLQKMYDGQAFPQATADEQAKIDSYINCFDVPTLGITPVLTIGDLSAFVDVGDYDITLAPIDMTSAANRNYHFTVEPGILRIYDAAATNPNQLLMSQPTETITYQYENGDRANVWNTDGTPAPNGEGRLNTHTETVTFTRLGYAPMAYTNMIDYSEWTPTTVSFNAVDTPSIVGYTADVTTVAATPATADGQPIAVIVTYKANEQKAVITYVDDSAGGVTVHTDTMTGGSAAQLDYTVVRRAIEHGLLTQGYLIDGDDLPTGNVITFDTDDLVNQTYTIHLKHSVTTITPDEPGTPGEPIKPGLPDWPADSAKAQLERTVTQRVQYVYAKGGKVADDIITTKTFQRTGTVDNVTGKVTNFTDWVAVDGDSFDVLTSPEQAGYTPDLTATEAYTVNANTGDMNLVVTYTTDGQRILINYVDDDASGVTVHTDTLTGGSETTHNYTNVRQAIEGGLLSLGYLIDGDDLPIGNVVTFDTDTKTDQTYTVHLKHSTTEITPDEPGTPGEPIKPGLPDWPADSAKAQLEHTVTQRVQYVYAKGGKVAADVVNVKVFQRTGTVDNVTGKVTNFTDWVAVDGDSFDALTSPEQAGYTPDLTATDAYTVNANTGDMNLVVTYTADQQQLRVVFFDDTTHQWLATKYATGETGTTSLYRTDSDIAMYLRLGFELVSDGYPTTGIVFDTDSTHHQTYGVHLKHGMVTATPAQPGKPGQAIDMDNPDGPKWPAETGIDGLQRVITQTIHYFYQDQTQAHADVVDQVTFTRTATVDKVTGATVFTDWVAVDQDTTFDAKTSPKLTGYTATPQAIAAVTGLNAASADMEETVIYVRVTDPTGPTDPKGPKTPQTTVDPNEPQGPALQPLDSRVDDTTTDTPAVGQLPQTGDEKNQLLAATGLSLIGMLGLAGAMVKRRREE